MWSQLGRRILADPNYPIAVEGPSPVASTIDPVAAGPGSGPPDGPPSPLVARLFAHHEELDARAVSEALRPIPLTELERAGLVARRGTQVTACFGVERWGPVVVVHDWPEWHSGWLRTARPNRPDRRAGRSWPARLSWPEWR